MGFSLKKIISTNDELNRIQTNIDTALNSINGPFIGGNLLTNVSIGTSATAINHGLGRTPQVWVLCDQNTNTTVARLSWNANAIVLVAGSNCNVSLWVN